MQAFVYQFLFEPTLPKATARRRMAIADDTSRLLGVLTKLGQRGYSVHEQPQPYGVDRIDTDTDSDPDQDNEQKGRQ